MEINDLLDANLEGLKMVFDKFKGKKHLHLEDCVNLFSTYSAIKLSRDLAKYCFGMSKMSHPEDYKTTPYRGYAVLEFVEFLEMICRVAI